jgi:dTDP-4-amino-4,6-dideoxygalactose transaminase
VRLRNYGQSERYLHPELGLNSRLDEIQAALLLERLAWLDSFTARRREIAAAYRAGISNPEVRHMAAPAEPAAHVHHLFVVLCESRDALQQHLAAAGIQSLCHYPVPVHAQASTGGLRRDPAGLGNAERHARSCLSLPCHPALESVEVDRVIDTVNSFRT